MNNDKIEDFMIALFVALGITAYLMFGCARVPPPSWNDQRCIDLTAQRDASYWGSIFSGGLAGVSGITAALPDDTENTSEATARNLRIGFGVGSVVAAAVGTSLAALARVKNEEIDELCEYVTVEDDGGVE